MPLHLSSIQLRPGTQLYKYRLLRRIGGGSFGEVWLAEDQAVGDTYAIKILNPAVTIHEGLREARIGHALKHSNVVRVHQADVIKERHHDYVVIAMDYIDGGPVTNLANSSRFVPLPDVVRLGRDILRGLEYLHSQSFYHNDVKPENVLLGPQNQGMLTDYGIVGIAHEKAPVSTPVFYKIHAAPEMVRKSEATARSDVFQVGLTLFRMLVGLDVLRHKFDTLGEQAYYGALSLGRLITAGDFPAFIPMRLRRLVRKATHPVVTSRFGSATEMRRALERLHYPGYWTVQRSGEFVGLNGSFAYRYEQRQTAANDFTVEAFRRNCLTGRETRCARYCQSDLAKCDAEREIARFVQVVVEKERPWKI